MISTDIVVKKAIEGPRDELFPFAKDVDLRQLFDKVGFIPRIKEVHQTPEGWNKAGATRTVVLMDNSTAGEVLTTMEDPRTFAYRIHSFTSALRFLLREIRGEWIFQESRGNTEITWHYSLVSHNRFCKGLVGLFLRRDMEGYMTKALINLDRLFSERDKYRDVDHE